MFPLSLGQADLIIAAAWARGELGMGCGARELMKRAPDNDEAAAIAGLEAIGFMPVPGEPARST